MVKNSWDLTQFKLRVEKFFWIVLWLYHVFLLYCVIFLSVTRLFFPYTSAVMFQVLFNVTEIISFIVSVL